MRLIDLYYRYFNDYKQSIQENTEGKRIRQSIKRANKDSDSITITKYTCDIKEDWIENIEDGLIYIEKALDEARQFIRTEGEVVRIDQVKKTSKASVKHLSRNSNLITRKPKKGQMMIPDKLYIVEKLSDYAVYENRFLLLLLTYLRDFIYTRLEKIKTKTTTYQSNMSINKLIDIHNRHIEYQLDFSDRYLNDPYLMKAYLENPIINRMEKIYYTVDGFLQMPLMKEVAKAPLLTLPIVKTNVLRMNPNFRAAVELYDYIMAYNELGYHFNEHTKTYNPFSDDMSTDIAEIIELTTYVSYKYGNDISSDLKNVYETEEEKNKLNEDKKKKAEIKRLKKLASQNDMNMEAYALVLEKRNTQLEKGNLELISLRKQNKDYKDQIDTLSQEKAKLDAKVKTLLETIKEKEDEILRRHNTYIHNMEQAEKSHQKAIEILESKHQKKIEEMHLLHEEKLNELQEQYQVKLKDLKDQFEEEKEALNASFSRKEETLKEEIKQLSLDKASIIEEKNDLIKENQEKIDAIKLNHQEVIKALEKDLNDMEDSKNQLKKAHDKQIDDLNNQHENALQVLNHRLEKLQKEKHVVKGQFYAFKQKVGLVTEKDDFTSKDKFKELEEMKRSFNAFFKEQWKETKAKIRANVKEKSKELLEKELSNQDTHTKD